MANRVCICHKTLYTRPWPKHGKTITSAAGREPARLLPDPTLRKLFAEEAGKLPRFF